MNIPIEEKKKEAIRRMRKLHYFRPSVEEFKKDGKVMINEPPFGAHYYIDDDEGLVQKIRELEQENNLLVYAVVRSFTNFGKMDSFLYVEDYRDEWEMFDLDIEWYSSVMSYTFNRDYPDCSEFGSIPIELTAARGILRSVC